MKKFFAFILTLSLLNSCIQNDLPYPVRRGSIVSLEVEDAQVTIDEAHNTVRLTLEETADLHQVNIQSASYLHEETVSQPEIIGRHDLSRPFHFTLKTYQDYPWTLVATQPIERSFTVKGQIGSSVVDDVNHRAVAYVSRSTDLTGITLTSLKLGPRDISEYRPQMSEIHDFTDGVEVEVKYHSHTEIWNLYVEQTDRTVQMDAVDAWTRCVWLYASGTADARNGFRYRQKGSETWMETTDILPSGGSFKACIEGLEPLTTYECVAFSGSEESELYIFETEEEKQLPNAGFECFSHAESSLYSSWFDPSSPWDDLQTKWWDSGNIGSTTIGSSYCIALPDTENKREGHSSASLVSRNVVVKFAAGNTFSGEFAGLVGTQGGIINFGRPWTWRPNALRVWLKYESGTIDAVDSYPDGETVRIGDPDACSVWVALGDWDYRRFGGNAQSPVQINTTDKSTFFNPASEAVIAYGAFFAHTSSELWTVEGEVISTAEDGWRLVEVPLNYQAFNRRPTHIIVSFASSRLGDYFTGSSKSRLWVDDVQLIY